MRGRQAADRPLAHAVGRVDAGAVGGLDVVLADEVDGAPARLVQVVQAVLGRRGLLQAPDEADDEQRGVVVDHLEVAEGREVGGGAGLVDGGDEGDGPRHDGADEELVVVHAGPAVGEGVDGDVPGVLLVRGEEGVGAAAVLPVRGGGLLVGEGLGGVQGRARGFDLLEVRVRVALDVGFFHLRGGGGGSGEESRSEGWLEDGGRGEGRKLAKATEGACRFIS